MNKKLYVAYGSNLNIAQMGFRCPDAKAVGRTVIMDYELLFRGSGSGSYLTVEPKRGVDVPAAVWSVTEADERALDLYEGFPVFYRKRELRLPVTDILTGAARMEMAFVYIMRGEQPLGMPRVDYVKTCVAGYRDFEFDVSVLKKACQKSGLEEIQWKMSCLK